MDGQADLEGLRRGVAMLEELRKVDRDMQLPMALTFLMIALEGEMTRTELMARLDVAGSTASRNITGLTAEGRAGRPGHGLLVQRTTPEELRLRPASLTPKGRLLALRLDRILRGDKVA